MKPVRCADCGYLEVHVHSRITGALERIRFYAPGVSDADPWAREERLCCFRRVAGFDGEAISRRWDCVKYCERRPELATAKEHWMIERMEAEQRRQARRQTLQAKWTIGIGIATVLAVVGMGLLNYFGS